jgi:hypothetical protein
MKLSKEEGRLVVYGDHEDWVTVKEEILETTRWSVLNLGVFMHIPTATHYEISWSVGATEYQYEPPFDCYEPELYEVEETEQVVTVWERVR